MAKARVPFHPGRVFGRWTLVQNVPPAAGSKTRRWLCRCACGTERAVLYTTLTSGSSVSCGCYHREVVARMKTTHGLSRRPEFNQWNHMRQRCGNPSDDRFSDYGGRGITVCERWLNSFEHFLADMGPRPSPKHSIDRIDNNGNYEPGNCRWATHLEQAQNTRTVLLVSALGLTLSVREWARRAGIHPSTLAYRIRSGWPIEAAVTMGPDLHRPKRPWADPHGPVAYCNS
jgi:hypothetical protein